MTVNDPGGPISLLVNVRDAARMLAISQAYVWRLIREGEIHPTRIGHRTLIARSELERYVDDLRSRCFTDQAACS